MSVVGASAAGVAAAAAAAAMGGDGGDLNKVGEGRLKEAKAAMDVAFEASRVRPGDEVWSSPLPLPRSHRGPPCGASYLI